MHQTNDHLEFGDDCDVHRLGFWVLCAVVAPNGPTPWLSFLSHRGHIPCNTNLPLVLDSTRCNMYDMEHHSRRTIIVQLHCRLRNIWDKVCFLPPRWALQSKLGQSRSRQLVFCFRLCIQTRRVLFNKSALWSGYFITGENVPVFTSYEGKWPWEVNYHSTQRQASLRRRCDSVILQTE